MHGVLKLVPRTGKTQAQEALSGCAECQTGSAAYADLINEPARERG
jgi:hypothetical protein